MTLLLVDPDDLRATVLASQLATQGFPVTRVDDGRHALEALAPTTRLVLLEVDLPDLDGIEVCARLRRRSDVPIIVLTDRADVEDRVQGLVAGADDYLVRPVDPRELLARIVAVTRRSERTTEDPATMDGAVVAGPATIDFAARRVEVEDIEVVLTRTEFDVLALLARHPGVVLPRERILREVWRTGWRGFGRSLEVHVGSLRRKLGTATVIETVRGVGYRFVPDDDR